MLPLFEADEASVSGVPKSEAGRLAILGKPQYREREHSPPVLRVRFDRWVCLELVRDDANPESNLWCFQLAMPIIRADGLDVDCERFRTNPIALDLPLPSQAVYLMWQSLVAEKQSDQSFGEVLLQILYNCLNVSVEIKYDSGRPESVFTVMVGGHPWAVGLVPSERLMEYCYVPDWTDD